MASNGEDDLNDFLKHEEEKFSQLGDPALTSSPPPDIQEIITQRDERERAIEMTSTALSQDTSDSMFSVEPECIQAWRRDKEEMLDQKEAELSEKMRKWREAVQQEFRDWYDHLLFTMCMLFYVCV
ncbi:hypothetical protein LOD99_923 [Oopsacas minuta]|uniref:Clathrin light chain n=1 Tax=Oopsacas minuta TaxID=111878 RepID=A0AAV7JZW8_9METZ|nr:hypothetical protein LOD99_923 [Oopsacas minuta]